MTFAIDSLKSSNAKNEPTDKLLSEIKLDYSIRKLINDGVLSKSSIAVFIKTMQARGLAEADRKAEIQKVTKESFDTSFDCNTDLKELKSGSSKSIKEYDGHPSL